MDLESVAIIGIVGAMLYYLWQTQTQTVSAGNEPTFTGGSLSPSQIAQVAAGAGFSGADLVTAVAISLAESGGNPNAHGDLNLPGQGSYGLWQIYSYAHPEFGPNFDALFDPATNAAAAYQIYQASGQRFTAWTGTYTNGLYLKFLPQAQAAVA